jgi:hypothetical protein
VAPATAALAAAAMTTAVVPDRAHRAGFVAGMAAAAVM